MLNRDMNFLVDELTKEKPDLKAVRAAMERLDLPYSDDPILLLNTVLKALHSQDIEKEAEL